MNAYIYRAALWCPDCIAKLKQGFESHSPVGPMYFLPEVHAGMVSGMIACPDGMRVINGQVCRVVHHAPVACPGDPSDEFTFDSDDYPKGPYPDGGGEADTAQHCDGCGRFLENPLTSCGEDHVREAVDSADGDPEVLATWREFYSYLFDR